MPVLRHGRPQRLEDADVLERVLHMVVAADDVRDVLVDVVHHVGDVEDGRAVRAHDGEVLDVFRLLGHGALDDVVEFDDAFLGHPEHGDDAGLALARGALDLVGVAAGEQLLDAFQVARDVLRLVEDRLVVVEPEPLHRVHHRGDRLRRRALEVGVLDAQKELAARMPRIQPVVDGRADVPDMDLARRRGGETHTYFRHYLFSFFSAARHGHSPHPAPSDTSRPVQQ